MLGGGAVTEIPEEPQEDTAGLPALHRHPGRQSDVEDEVGEAATDLPDLQLGRPHPPPGSLHSHSLVQNVDGGTFQI